MIVFEHIQCSFFTEKKMLFIKQGMPQEGDIVFCTVTKIQYHSVFASLDEYKHKSGMIHISEISPGRIRNINDYVKEGKVIVCKILRINKERGHIDLSLRRVNESQRRAKIEERKQQGIAENILHSYAQNAKLEVKNIYIAISKNIMANYDSFYSAFEDVVENNASLVDLGIDKNLAEALEVLIRERIKPKEVFIGGEVTLQSFDSNGVDIINKVILEVSKISPEFLKLRFLGAGKYKLEARSRDYKEAENLISKALKTLEAGTKDPKTSFKFDRD